MCNVAASFFRGYDISKGDKKRLVGNLTKIIQQSILKLELGGFF